MTRVIPSWSGGFSSRMSTISPADIVCSSIDSMLSTFCFTEVSDVSATLSVKQSCNIPASNTTPVLPSLSMYCVTSVTVALPLSLLMSVDCLAVHELHNNSIHSILLAVRICFCDLENPSKRISQPLFCQSCIQETLLYLYAT